MAGVYISYPFCAQKCSFCNFASGVFAGDARRSYEAALLEQLRAHTWAWSPQTLYIGGGTPSLMSLEYLDRLIELVPSASVREFTLECAPGTVTRDLAAGWARPGVNRVSLGVQSFVQRELARTGRKHTAEIVSHDVDALRSAGIENLNLDLIAGLPGQTGDSWQDSLNWIEQLNPPHVSVYIFEVDEDSRLGNEILTGGERYGAGELPSEELTAEMYESAVARLHRLGIERYEISNFARPGFESLHNLKYWKLEPYAGFGLDAHSFDGARRSSAPDNLLAYLKPWEAVIEDTDSGEEHFFVGLRLASGIQPRESEWKRFAAPIEKWVSRGLLVRDGDWLRLSSDGVLVSNEIFQEFIHV